MKPVFQTEFGEGKGNCYQACLASIFDAPLWFVPNFCIDFGNEWFGECQQWLNRFGLALLHCRYDVVAFIPPLDTHYIVSGKSPRGPMHSVVHHSGKMIHDPHPNGYGILEAEIVEFFIGKNPGDAMKAAFR